MKVSPHDLPPSKLARAYARVAIEASEAMCAHNRAPSGEFPLREILEQQYLANVLDTRIRRLSPPIPEGTIVRVVLRNGTVVAADRIVWRTYRSEHGTWLYQVEEEGCVYAQKSLRVIWDFASLMRTLKRRLD